MDSVFLLINFPLAWLLSISGATKAQQRRNGYTTVITIKRINKQK
jgi:hypothetical protein